MVRDPARTEHCMNGEDGTHFNTVVAVYKNPAFKDIMTKAYDNIHLTHGDKKFVVFQCRTSYHRADTSARTTEATTNAMEIRGKRAFGSMYFDTLNSQSARQV